MKKILIIFLLALAGVVQGQTFKTLATSAGLEHLPSYTIQEISGTVYARPALNSGYTAYADTNLTTVLNNAMGQLTDGGLIQIKKGVYDHLLSIVVPYDNITVEGEGRPTKLQLRYHADEVANGHLFYVNGKDNFTVRDLEMDGNLLEQTRIDTDGTALARSCAVFAYDTVGYSTTNNLKVENCYIHDFSKEGIVWQNGEYCLIENCDIEHCGWGAFEFYYAGNHGTVNNCRIKNTAVGTIYGDYARYTNNIAIDPWFAENTGNTDFVLTLESYTFHDPDYCYISDCSFTGTLMQYAIAELNSCEHLTINNVTISGQTVNDAVGIELRNDTSSVISNIHISNITASGGVGVSLVGSQFSTLSNINVYHADYTGISLSSNADNNVITNSYLDADTYPAIVASGCDDNVIANSVTKAYNNISNSGTATVSWNNYSVYHKIKLPDIVTKNSEYTATSGGLTTGIIVPGSQNITVTSSNADYICCLPAASATSIGTVITGLVGANGFELRVAASQAASVYLNGVTTNVEAAIPANTNFRVTQIDATHWILECTTNLGAVVTAIIPDAI